MTLTALRACDDDAGRVDRHRLFVEEHDEVDARLVGGDFPRAPSP
ncbi:MAG: hypothetical protein R2724_14010 [Bryobacterales bacterium]